ncbi:MAG TPA: peptidoglycan-binding protein [Saprospiraceae bacterium]|nr:peptidoglycan-binding protein [Saprospiraceae bacterium]
MKNVFLLALCIFTMKAFSQVSSSDLPFSDLPPVNEYGKCYAKCKIPDEYETFDVQVLVKGETKKLVKVPAKYDVQTERILVKEASSTFRTIPATYKTESEQILVEPEKKVVKTVPAKYKTESRRILVSEAHGEWVKKKKAPNCLSQNPEDCYIVCYEEIPAKYRTETTTVEVEPARTIEETIPARYKTVSKRVVDQPARTEEVPIPAVYQTVSKRVMVEPESVREVVTPAVYKIVKERRLVKTGGFTVWTEILCEGKTTNSKISAVQKALKAKGYSVGVIDGKMGLKTQTALKQFQTENGLPTGNLNIQTLQALGIDAE